MEFRLHLQTIHQLEASVWVLIREVSLIHQLIRLVLVPLITVIVALTIHQAT